MVVSQSSFVTVQRPVLCWCALWKPVSFWKVVCVFGVESIQLSANRVGFWRYGWIGILSQAPMSASIYETYGKAYSTSLLVFK